MKIRTFVSIAALAAATASTAAAAGPVVTTRAGALEGSSLKGVEAFLGIPYAAPPTGSRRWQPPVPAAAWAGTRAATAFSASCPQTLNPPQGRGPWTPEYLIPGAQAEDCLHLNVWRPAGNVKGAPVMFWIHGGGGVEGSTSVPIYDGAALAAKGIIVVSINYRLGVLAYLAHPELSQAQGGASGNYGLQDVLAALRWTRENVAAFGGDPNRITIAGQSAGSGYVAQLIGSPAAKGMFVRAITQSGSAWGTRAAPVAPAVADAGGVKFAAAAGAADLAALRAMPADQIVAAAERFSANRFPIVQDGKVLVNSVFEAQAAPGFNDTPILSGYNADEQSGNDGKYGSWTVEEFNKKRDGLYGKAAAEAARHYPASTAAEAATVGVAMARDYTRSIMYEWIKRRAPVSQHPAYLYHFEHPLPGPTSARYGSFHSSEIPYVFGTLVPASRGFTATDRAISDGMMSRWVNFIKNGDPNASGLAQWSAWNPASAMVMRLGDGEKMEPILPADKRALADSWADSLR